MDGEEASRLAEEFLSAWNSQEVDRVISCYTQDCVYLDPNIKKPIIGHKALRRYLTRLFRRWKMEWSLKEMFRFADGEGVAFLWHARLTPVPGGGVVERDGMDLAVVRGQRLCRNEVYFDRLGLNIRSGQ